MRNSMKGVLALGMLLIAAYYAESLGVAGGHPGDDAHRTGDGAGIRRRVSAAAYRADAETETAQRPRAQA